MGTVAVGAILVLIIGASIIHIVKKKKNGGGSCSCGCGGCSMSGICNGKKEK